METGVLKSLIKLWRGNNDWPHINTFKAFHSAKDWRPLDTWKLYQYDLNEALAKHTMAT